jgi:hypothetical protein
MHATGVCIQPELLAWRIPFPSTPGAEMYPFSAPFKSSLIDRRTPWSQSASELCRPSDCRLSTKLVPIFADRGCCVLSATDTHGRVLGFLDRSRYYFFQVVPQLHSRGWVNPVPDPLLPRKLGSTWKRTRTSGSVARDLLNLIESRHLLIYI